MTALPRTTTDLARADQRNARLHADNIELQRQVEDLSRVLINTAEDEIAARGPRFWSCAFHEARMLNARLKIDLDKRNAWLLEQGQEATRLQSELAFTTAEVGRITRLHDDAQGRVDELEVELDRLRQRLCECAGSEVD